MNKTGTRAVPDDRKVVPIARNSLGSLGSLEVLYAYCRRCKRDRRLNVPALLRRYGDLHLRRLRANRVLQARISHLLTRPVGRPPKKPQVFFASFSYQAQSWTKPRRVIAKVEWHQGELYPRVGFIVTNLSRPADRVTKRLPRRPGPSVLRKFV